VFTGIIEAIGQIQAVESQGESARIRLRAPEGFGPLEIGESVAVDGACLTADQVAPDGFAANVSHETLARTTLGRRRPGQEVNLERAMALGGRLGGHLVSGHVDATGRIRSLTERQGSWDLAVEAPGEILALCVEKGSIAVDGVSLTIAALEPWGFACAIVPHTLRAATLGRRRAGDEVNLESDLIGKYVRRLLGRTDDAPGAVTMETLKNAGFL
jgi:riboflavin synthase